MTEQVDTKQPRFVRITAETVPVVVQALQAAGYDEEARNVEAFARSYTDPDANRYRAEWVEKARQ
jgi:hypothetical protein